MCAFFVGLKNNRLFIITAQYFLLFKQSKIEFTKDCYIAENILNPIDIL